MDIHDIVFRELYKITKQFELYFILFNFNNKHTDMISQLRWTNDKLYKSNHNKINSTQENVLLNLLIYYNLIFFCSYYLRINFMFPIRFKFLYITL